MLLAGDEFGRTQRGNNNAYCQDNTISWVDWSALLSREPNAEKSLAEFTRRLAALRAAHPSLRSEKFLHGTAEILPGLDDAAWFDENAVELDEAAWADGVAQRLVLRRAVLNGGQVDITCTLLNASGEQRDFAMPNPDLPWEILLDSANPDSKPLKPRAKTVPVAAHAVVLLGAVVARP